MQATKMKTYCVCVFQFAVLMWLLTYVGALFNGLTLLILGEVIPIIPFFVYFRIHVPEFQAFSVIQ